MSTAKFRNQIYHFKQSLPGLRRIDGRDYKNRHTVKFIDQTTPGDQLIMDFINNVDFDVLYQSKEFREMLDKRMEIKRLHRSIME